MSEIIRKAKPGDLERIAEIWQLSFGDEKEYTDFFLKNRINDAITLVLEKDGTVVSQLFLLPVTAEGLHGYYLYAAATDVKCRGKGLMAKLLREAEKEAVGNGKDFIFLVPGTESLYAYYKKFGYEASFYKYTGKLPDTKISAADAKISDKPHEVVGILSNFGKCICWDRTALLYAANEFLTFRGRLITVNGKSVIMADEDEAVIISDSEDLDISLAVLSSLAENRNITVTSNVPVGNRSFGGMVLKISENAKKFSFNSMFVFFAKE